jgi:translation initiation factor IF-2
MANLSVEKLATVIGSAPDLLLSQMKEAGLTHSKVSDEVTDSDKRILLEFLKKQQNQTTKTISLNKTKSKDVVKESGVVAITRKRVSKETASNLEEKVSKTSTSIDNEGIEKKRQAVETQKQVDEDKRILQNEQKTLITRRKAKSKESPSSSKDVKQVVQSKRPPRSQRSDISKKEKRELEGESFLSNVKKQEFEKPSEFISKNIQIPESITVSELAQNLSIKGGEVVKKLMSMGVMATLNQPLDQDTAILVTEELGHKGEPAKKVEVEDKLMELVTMVYMT